MNNSKSQGVASKQKGMKKSANEEKDKQSKQKGSGSRRQSGATTGANRKSQN